MTPDCAITGVNDITALVLLFDYSETEGTTSVAFLINCIYLNVAQLSRFDLVTKEPKAYADWLRTTTRQQR